jgi:Tfp pilus assembly protein PilX
MMKSQGITRTSGGFALVITLLLMILLTIIAVGLLTLGGITLRASAGGFPGASPVCVRKA